MPNNLQGRKEESMGNPEYHKGSFCVYMSIFCQEGYCSECEIYSRRQSLAKPTTKRDGVRDVRKLQEAVAK